MADMFFEIGNSGNTMSRKVYNLQNLLSDMGGTVSAMMGIFAFIVSAY